MTTKWGDGDVFATCSPAIESSNTVLYAGNAQGRVAGFDMRSSLQHTAGFRGCQGSVRSIALHPTEPKMAVYGLDRYIHLYSTSTHKQLGALYTKQHGTSIDFFDEVFFSDDKQDLRSQHESANGRGRKRVQPDSSDNEDDDGNEERNKNDSL
jgi:WD40 repeat protein